MKKKLFLATLASAVITPVAVAPAYAAEGPFTDVAADYIYAEQLLALKEANIITGFSDGTYRPNDTISRQHVVAMLARVVDFEPQREAKHFSDVPTTHPYYKEITAAYRAGVIDGNGDKFNPNASVTRAQMAKMLVKALELNEHKGNQFADVDDTYWSKDYINTLAYYDITTGVNGNFEPNKALTRAHLAVFLYRALAVEDITDYAGEWQGVLALEQVNLTMRLAITEDGEALISIPLQGLNDYPVSEVTLDNGNIKLVVKLPTTEFTIEGSLVDGNIEAVFTQNGGIFNMLFKPYEAPEITYDEVTVPVAGGMMKAALQMPETTSEPMPVALIIAGSGPTDKDGNSAIMGENNSLKMVAEGLADEGISTLRFDKRGVGVNQALVTTEDGILVSDFVADVTSLIAFLQQDKRFSEVHIIGHSEGALMATLAALQTEVASVTTVAGAGRPIDEILVEQLRAQAMPTELLQQAENILTRLKNGEHVADVPQELLALFRPSIQDYMIQWLQNDPAVLLSQVKVPVLIVQGENDLQVQVADAERLHAQTPNAEIAYFATMNHVLKDAPSDRLGNIATYSQPDLPLAKGFLEAVVKFIKQ